jgi:hypothetical protein
MTGPGLDYTSASSLAVFLVPPPDETRHIYPRSSFMNSLRIWIILSWIALPTVMFGGCSLLQLINR